MNKIHNTDSVNDAALGARKPTKGPRRATVSDAGLPRAHSPAPHPSGPSRLFREWQLCHSQLNAVQDEDSAEYKRLCKEFDRLEAEIEKRPQITAVDLAELFIVLSVNFTVVPQDFDTACMNLTRGEASWDMNSPRVLDDELNECYREAVVLVGLAQALDKMVCLIGPKGQPVVSVIEATLAKASALEAALDAARELA
ncbi:MAG: hypothetical protein Q7J44_11565 [Pseudotabrizicola sp.]|uniref:hypothetical protein n=1 Tax=Pseudotabrizicola sp. TaxID=2939647 RepID=UPI00272131F6|nr:hypothetical protein [Pseudotabrizicola sp.]MDO9639168.1 hypothetical protein [Pseudotabrizicola sp.]